MDIFKFDIGAIPIKMTRMVLLLLFYASVKKPNIYLTIFIVTSFTASIMVFKNQLNITALSIEFLSRTILLYYSYQIIKWDKIKKIKFLYILLVPILIAALFFTMFINNKGFYKQNIEFIILAISCELLLLIVIITSLVNFLNNQRKGNKEFLIGTTITLLGDLFYSVQDVSTSVDTSIVGISSFLYSTGFYLIIVAYKKRID